jgi:outer membrane protein assembly factor BamB
VVAFEKDTGKEVWRALTAHEIGYAPPMIYQVGDSRQLVVWHPDAVSGLVPETGEVLWTHPYPVEGKPQRPEVTIAAPRLEGDQLFVTSFYQGATLLKIPSGPGEAEVVWNRKSKRQSEKEDGLHTVLGTPAIRNGFIFGVCAFGELRCLELKTGDRQWESLELFRGQGGFFANAFMVQNGERWFYWNDQGELLIGRMDPERFELIDRAKLLDPRENTRGRDVLWCHPAFANRSAYLHNGRELICVDLAG